MILSDFQMAYASFKTARVRSLLTVLGIAVGVASIVLIYSLGRGITKSYTSEKIKLGDNTIVITPGKLVVKSDSGKITRVDLTALIGSSTLTEKDVAAIKEIKGVSAITPTAIMTGLVQTETTKDNAGTSVIAVNADFIKIVGQKVKFGSFISPDDTGRNLAIVGKSAAELLFQEESPIGRMVKFRGTDFVVKGVFDEFTSSGTNPVIDYNNSIFVPLETAKKLSGNVLEIREIKVLVDDTGAVDSVADAINSELLKEHKNQADFTIYKRDEYLTLTEQLFGYVTAFVTAVASISLFVGGVGIMNIMFVSVSERTKEIGVRKALGATSRQILGQFLVEAIILSFVGGVIGVLMALGGGYIITLRTQLEPVYGIELLGTALLLSLVIGTIFGIAPAIKASHQDPIKSLRHH